MNLQSQFEEYYQLLDSYVDMTVKGYSNSLIVHGNFGVGKSFRIIQKLKESGCPYEYISGRITPLDLFHVLYEHNGKVLFLDDVGGSIFEDVKAIEILKPALQEVAGKRIISYYSTSDKVGNVKQFEYTGTLIIATNELPDSTLSLRAMLSRPLVLEMFFSHKELIEMFKAISQKDYKTTTLKQRQTVIKYIKDNVNESCDNLSIRTLLKGFEMIAYNEKEWIELFKPVLKINDNIKTIIENETERMPMQIDKWKEQTGLSERSFYKYLHELRKRRGLCSKFARVK